MLKAPSALLDLSELFEPAAPDAALLGIGGMNSISDGPDDGAIDKLAGLFWKPMRHLTMTAARDNLSLERRDSFPLPGAGQRETREQNIAGHGTNGYIEVGDGQGWGGEYISYWNEEHWGWDIALAGRDWDGGITFWSCSTGAGWSGSQLLFRIAQITKRTVRARTGLLLVVTRGSQRWVEYERGSTWQQADPSMTAPPPPINPPSVPAALKTVADAPFDAARIVSAKLRRRGRGGWAERWIAPQDLPRLAQLVFASPPLPGEGTIPGLVTAIIDIALDDGTTLAVTVLADRIAEVDGQRFMVSPALTDLIGESLG